MHILCTQCKGKGTKTPKKGGRGRERRPKPEKRTAPRPQATPLNARQKVAWPAIQKQGAVTRKEYQEMAGGQVPTRTAIYDLQDFVKRGLLVKRGKGPSTRYEITG